MKIGLIKGIVLIGAVVLSSCSSTSKLAGLKNAANDDDVYYTKAKAGDQNEYIANVSQQSNSNYNGDDDYYYYGDYASRLSHFANYTPFDYTDNFYYTYVPYNNGFGAGLEDNTDYYSYHYANNGASVAMPDNGYVYSPYDYGYSPYYDMGYDDFGYGNIYSAYILGGGGGGGYSGGGYGHLWNKHYNTTSIATITNPNARGVRTTPSPGVTRLTAYPGNPLININRTTSVTTRTNNLGVNNNNNTARQSRESYRPVQQQQSIAPPPSNTSSSSSSSSSTSSGGGGRPVRP